MTKVPLSDFAFRRTQLLLRRLAVRLRRAAKHPDDPETIHDLRVSIRRFLQCLRTFENLFHPITVKRVRKRLKKVMTLGGETRNCDVALELLQVAGVPPSNPAYSILQRRRREAKKELARRLARKSITQFAKRNRLDLEPQPSAAKQWQLHGGVGQNARVLLPSMCEEFFLAGAATAGSREDYETLHQFRLRAKRFRYTLELFEDSYGIALARRLTALRRLQEKLGSINDCLTTLELIAEIPSAAPLIRKTLASRDVAFREYWKVAFAGPIAQQWRRWLAQKDTKNTSLRNTKTVTVARKTADKAGSIQSQ